MTVAALNVFNRAAVRLMNRLEVEDDRIVLDLLWDWEDVLETWCALALR